MHAKLNSSEIVWRVHTIYTNIYEKLSSRCLSLSFIQLAQHIPRFYIYILLINHRWLCVCVRSAQWHNATFALSIQFELISKLVFVCRFAFFCIWPLRLLLAYFSHKYIYFKMEISNNLLHFKIFFFIWTTYSNVVFRILVTFCVCSTG